MYTRTPLYPQEAEATTLHSIMLVIHCMVTIVPLWFCMVTTSPLWFISLQNNSAVSATESKYDNSTITECDRKKYPMDQILKCFCSILFDVLLCSSYNVVWLREDILFPWNIPDVNGLRIGQEGSYIMLIDISRTSKIRKDQPAG